MMLSRSVFLKTVLLLSIFISSMNVFADSNQSLINFSVIKTAESNGTLEALVVKGGGIFTIRNLIHTAVLVTHPKGDFLWDTGIGKQIKDQMSVFSFIEKQLFSIKNIDTAYDQLSANDYAIGSLMAIIPSHMHWDHVSALEDFIGAPVWVQNQSLEEARKGSAPAFVKSQYDSLDINWQLLELHDIDYKGFERSYDIYGDGSAVLVDLSGHTDGQLGLFLTMADDQVYFFIGDTTWVVLGINDKQPRPPFLEWFLKLDTDLAKNERLINKIHNLAKMNPNMVIVPAHDELSAMPMYPDFSH